MWSQLWTAGWLEATDEPLVTMACQAADELKVLEDAVRTEGRWFENRNGQKVTHPAVKQLHELENQFTEWLVALGVSPMARSRLGIVAPTGFSKLDELNARRTRSQDV